ncbi:DUF2267 domain-containing protein [Plantactinospora siamensis]|uniref:DUF2267 domain-containing protein n=1 Tax=Plantactinospora siamensis TaxID=555372 RepID=A0ABV6P4B4_9ACTN
MGKQMEGDNPRRRALARRARQQGEQASGTGATLGASKQPRSRPDRRRQGPEPVGRHKPPPGRVGVGPGPTVAERPWPYPDEPAGEPTPQAAAVPVIRYRDLVEGVGRRTGEEFREARAGAEATVRALAAALVERDRERLLDAVPGELRGSDAGGVDRHRDLAGFLAEVARLCRRTPEQARYQAQATLAALAEQDPELVGSLELPPGLTDLIGPLPAGGDGVAPGGGTAPLPGPELAAALADLPYWSVEGHGLVRTIELPPENLDRVLQRLAGLKPASGRGPSIGRPGPGSAVLTVRTRRVDGVTGLDVALAHDVDAAIEEAGAGMT